MQIRRVASKCKQLWMHGAAFAPNTQCNQMQLDLVASRCNNAHNAQLRDCISNDAQGAFALCVVWTDGRHHRCQEREHSKNSW